MSTPISQLEISIHAIGHRQSYAYGYFCDGCIELKISCLIFVYMPRGYDQCYNTYSYAIGLCRLYLHNKSIAPLLIV